MPYLGRASVPIRWASPDVRQNLLYQPTLIGAYVDAHSAWPLVRRFALNGTATNYDFGFVGGEFRLR
jgi:hypothetical protein